MTAVGTIRTICLLILVVCLAVSVGQAVMAGDEPAGVAPAAAEAGSATAGGETSQSGRLAPSTQALLASLTIFVLAMLNGFDIITKVPPTLHTPLMSGSNAISGITVVGALVASGAEQFNLAAILGTAAVAFAMAVNVVGGFLVTHRMLKMFKKK